MKSISLILFLSVLALAQLPAKPQSQKKAAPRLGFAEAKDVTPIVDTDVYDEQKYIETVEADTTAVKAKRAAHEAALTREFMDGFSAAKECDGIVFLGEGQNKPDFALQIIVDSHDTPGQKPVWNWIIRDIHTGKLMPVGTVDTGKQAAQGICVAIKNQADADLKQASL